MKPNRWIRCLIVALSISLLASASVAEDRIDEEQPPKPIPTRAEPTVAQTVGDVLFSRPIHAVRLITGVVMLPLALPVAAILGDASWAIGVCVTEPAEDLFQRPLGRL